MDGLGPLLLIAGLVVAIFSALGVWSWRRFARTSSFGAGASTAAVALFAPTDRIAAEDARADKNSIHSSASPLDTSGNPKGGLPEAPVSIDDDDLEGCGAPPSSPAPPEFLSVKDDAPKKQAEHGPDSIPTFPAPLSAAATTLAGAGPSVSASDDGPGTACDDAEHRASRAGRVCGETAALPRMRDALPEADDGIPHPADVGPEGQSASAPQDSPDLASDPGDEIAAEPAQTFDREEDVCGQAGHDVDQSGAIAEPNAKAAERTDASSDASEEAGPDKPSDGDRGADPAPVIEPAPEVPKSSTSTRSRKPAVHRDRRGSRRGAPASTAPSEAAPAGPAPAARPAAEAKLRLSLHPIRRTARISVVLTRPEGFPERVTLQAGVESIEYVLDAYDTARYDDLDLPWTSGLLDGELRLASTDGFRWLRSARRVHIFAGDPNEPDLMSVGSARPGVEHALVCRSGDAADIRAAANSSGSPELHTHEHWQGIPDGWMVLSRYTPMRSAVLPLPYDLRSLDPGAGLEILFEGGLAIRPRVYAAGHPPRIAISPAPNGASITIGGEPATLSANGAWEAPGWDLPGQHIVDVVPGPSVSYEIAADPWAVAGWDFWNAHSGRFENRPLGPWAQAEICGAQIRGPAGEVVFAAETQPTLIALGSRSGAVSLQGRGDVSVSIGFMAEAPAFLLSATGQRRTQGEVVWLGLTPTSEGSRRPDPDWVAAVRAAASRRLPLNRADALGENTWRKAKERARRLKRPRT